MQLPYFFHEELQIDRPVLSEETSKHIVQVLRMKEGALLQLTNGGGLLTTAKIVDAHKKRCKVEIVEKEKSPPGHRPSNIIGVSILKNTTRLEWFMEKATETGVNAIIPLICDRTERTNFRTDRMKGILVSAMLQSRQVWLPQLYEPVKYRDSLDLALPVGAKYIAHCYNSEKESFREKAQDIEGKAILIGPEGDFSPAEIEIAIEKGWHPVHLGTHRLRTETAAVAAAVLMNL